MTVVIAVRCQDGLIVASDSQATEETGHVKHTTPKIHRLGQSSVWSGAGTSQILSEIGSALLLVEAHLDSKPSEDIGQAIVDVVRPTFVRHYGNFIRGVPGMTDWPTTSLLAVGYAGSGVPWIVEVDPTCNYCHYDTLGFHAIGSAAGFAQLAHALMAHFDLRDRPLSHGQLVAYRAIDAAIETSSSGVSGPIQMWTITPRAVTAISHEELIEIRDNVGAWRAVERETLTDFLATTGLDAPFGEDVIPGMPPPSTDASDLQH